MNSFIFKTFKQINKHCSDPSITKQISINFTYGDENDVNSNTNIIKSLPSITFQPNGNNSVALQLTGQNVGHLVVGAQSNQIKM